jgi:hypothetical protein
MKRFLAIAAVALLTSAGTVHAQYQPDRSVQVLDTWYRHYLGRPIDQAGVDYWYPRITSEDARHVLAAMLESEEYLRRNGNTPQGLVLGLYRDVLGRANPAGWEVERWVNTLLQSGSRADMIEQFLQGVDVFNPPARPAVPVTPAPAPQYMPPAYSPPAYAPRVPPYRYIPYPY